MNKEQSRNFLNKELKDLAKVRRAEVLPTQATVNMAEVANVHIKNVTSRRP